ncbi:hypothetical protein BJV82DRAFT_646392 [Fennellomyces sp. T-0311]|nr:hypothetical protein BJV82DRAFT_646392 [Fennellomyces sp. T-0311]
MRRVGHRSTRSVSSLPSDLQKLSLYPTDDVKRQDEGQHLPFSTNGKTPSWMYGGGPVLLPPLPGQRRHRPGTHGRSVSEYTLQPQVPKPLLPSSTFEKRHRRAISANTVDFFRPVPSTSSSTSSTTSQPPRAQSDSPPEQYQSPPLQPQQDADDHMQHLQRDATSGRYLCPYCNKGFSRPSSLRIHTYSHTGEKPFVCAEEGCGRRFSVQSNMRRHLRVHRLGRSSVKTGSPLRKL